MKEIFVQSEKTIKVSKNKLPTNQALALEGVGLVHLQRQLQLDFLFRLRLGPRGPSRGGTGSEAAAGAANEQLGWWVQLAASSAPSQLGWWVQLAQPFLPTNQALRSPRR